MKNTFIKWFVFSFIVQIIIVPGAMALKTGEIIIIPYWILGYALAIFLGLPEKGLLSILIPFTIVAAVLSLLLALAAVGIKYLRQTLPKLS